MPTARGRARALALTVGPAVAYLCLFFLVPLGIVVWYSFSTGTATGDIERTFTLENYRRALDPLYLNVLARSAWLALLTTAIALAVGYPAAWAIHGLERRWRPAALALVILPSWMNLLVKNYAWIVILRREGVLNTLLQALGLIDQPLPLLFNPWAVLVGLVHTYLPFMILPLYAALDRLDWSLVEAARDLGAGRWQTFRRVVLPQTLTGVLAGCTLVFIPALGAFVTPDLLGGARSLMVATLIENQVLQVRNWPFAAALSVWLMLLVLGAGMLYLRLVPARRRGHTEARVGGGAAGLP
ncbi:MAG: ABC transporter permease [Gemmatimonadetes bacterium]|nr:ABC transporter permease [Gemmatimonadota bacterium]